MLALVTIVVLVSCAASSPRYSGTVQTESIAVGSQVGGRVIEVDVAAGTVVHRGSVIVRLDPSMLQALLDEALAQERSAAFALDALRLGTLPSQVELAQGSSRTARAAYVQTLSGAQARREAAAAAVESAAAAEDLARRNYDRTRSLAATGDVSRQTLDAATAELAQSRAELAQAQAQQQELLIADLPSQTASTRASAAANNANYAATANGVRPAQIAQARAELRDAQAAVAYARARLREATIRSTADGVVSSFNLHPGDMLAENQTAAIVDTFANPYVYVYASQADLQALRGAKRIAVRSDAGAGTFEGTIEQYDRTAQFTPQNVETADQRAELVYGVKIRIDDPHHALLDGTTVTIEPQ